MQLPSDHYPPSGSIRFLSRLVGPLAGLKSSTDRWVLPSLAIVLGLDGWLLSGILMPLGRWREVEEYLLLGPSLWMLVGCTLGALALLVAFERLFAGTASEDADDGRLFAASARPLLSPVWLLAFSPLGVALLATPVREYAAPWLFLGIDLRWWLVAGAGLLVVREIVVRSHPTLEELPLAGYARSLRLQFWPELTLVTSLMLLSLMSSPLQRFEPYNGGDEPKYLRYLENWYRGRGFDIEGLRPLSERPSDEPSHVWRNVTLLGPALTRIARDLGQDFRHALDPAVPIPPRSDRVTNGFLQGKRGGVYEVHSPGLSFLLFPAYLIDRARHPQPVDPTEALAGSLFWTNLAMLGLYGLWGLLVFRLLREWTGRTWLPWGLTVAGMASLPMSAFAYQYYPEVAAGVVIVALARVLVSDETMQAGRGLWYGVLTGYLPWLHVRFGLIALVCVAAMVFKRRSSRMTLAYLVGFALPLVLLASYDYNVSGSPLPLFLVDVTQPFRVTALPHALLALGLDRRSGLAGLAPIYLVALPGVWPAVRRRPAATITLAALALALVIPAAGVGWRGGLSLPLRLVAAAVPLWLPFVAEACLACGRSRAFAIGSVLLAVLSVEQALTLNSQHARSAIEFLDRSVSGWKPLLLLPNLDRPEWGSDGLLPVWLALSVGLLLLPAWLAHRPIHPQGPARVRSSWTRATAAGLILLGITGSTVAAVTGRGREGRYSVRPAESRAMAARALLNDRFAVWWSSRRGWVEPDRFTLYPDEFALELTVRPAEVAAGEPAVVSVVASAPNDEQVLGMVVLDFGDGSPQELVSFVGQTSVEHVFSHRGRYYVTANVSPPGRLLVERHEIVDVGTRESNGPQSR